MQLDVGCKNPGGNAIGKDSRLDELSTREERQGYLEEQLRWITREWIERMVDEELEAALGIGWSERGPGRMGYRKGIRKRTFTTRNGSHRIAMPRATLIGRAVSTRSTCSL